MLSETLVHANKIEFELVSVLMELLELIVFVGVEDLRVYGGSLLNATLFILQQTSSTWK